MSWLLGLAWIPAAVAAAWLVDRLGQCLRARNAAREAAKRRHPAHRADVIAEAFARYERAMDADMFSPEVLDDLERWEADHNAWLVRQSGAEW